MVDLKKLLTVAEAAKFSSDLSEAQIRNRLNDGRIRATIVGASRYVHEDDLIEYLQASEARTARRPKTN
jgi:hypothetical protein